MLRHVGPQWEQELRLEKEVIGSGCIAQVYRGHVHDGLQGGVDVAVKVIHPNVKACACMHACISVDDDTQCVLQQLIHRDLAIFGFFAHIVDRIPYYKYISLPQRYMMMRCN